MITDTVTGEMIVAIRPTVIAKQRKAHQRRESSNSSMGWFSRGAVVVAMAIMAYYSVVYSVAPILSRHDVARAHTLARSDSQITARLAMSLSGPGATKDQRLRADQLARQALLNDATSVVAAATLGLNADIRGDKALARHAFTYSESLSRRYLVVQMWAIENAVADGNIAGALKHYDIALRTSPQSANLLFPVLAAASSDLDIRPRLIQILATKPLWGEAFVNFLAEEGRIPSTAATLFLELRRHGGIVPDKASTAVIDALAKSGHVDEAWSYYASLRNHVDRSRSRDPNFTANLGAPSQLDWVPVESPGITTSIQRAGSGGMFEFAAPASVGGPLVRQLQFLPPGIYSLFGHGRDINQPDGERPYWLLTCYDGRELGRVELPNSMQSNGMFTGRVTVPSGCGIQMLQLVGRPVSVDSGLTGSIDRLQLEPVR